MSFDTEDIVRRVREFLALNGISQRQLGDHVLGLSQVQFLMNNSEIEVLEKLKRLFLSLWYPN